MSVIDIKNPTTNVVTEGVRAEVTLTKSWAALPLATKPARPAFDPRAAGRRAVAKHGDALRRLSS